MTDWVPRRAAALVDELARHLRIVMVSGPRQSGKTSLLRRCLADTPGSYRTLDQSNVLQAAVDDPVAFATYGDPPRGIDEVQRGGDDLIRAIKMEVDNNPTPGRFLLSGSSRFLTVPTLSESLAGRMAMVQLWPLSMAERTGWPGDFLQAVFDDPSSLMVGSSWSRRHYIDTVVAGGFPEVATIGPGIARRAWFDGYINTVIQRDIHNFATISRADMIGRLLAVIAVRSGSVMVLTDLAKCLEMSRDTVRSYLAYLDMVYLTTQVSPWSANLTSRLIKTPKTYPTDSGLAAHLMSVDTAALETPGHSALGPLVETFVLGELRKNESYSDLRTGLYHLRSVDKTEVDFVIEGPGNAVVAIEVKASSSPPARALNGLRWLRERIGDKLTAGILLHLGTEAASHGDRIYSIPLSALWGNRPLPD